MFISVTFIAMLSRFVTMSLVCEYKNNGDKLHRRKSMQAADEKLIINKLGPYLVSLSNGWGHDCQMLWCECVLCCSSFSALYYFRIILLHSRYNFTEI